MKSVFKFLLILIAATFSISASAKSYSISSEMQNQAVQFVNENGIAAVPAMLATVAAEDGAESADMILAAIVNAFPEQEAQILSAIQNSANLSATVKSNFAAIISDPNMTINVVQSTFNNTTSSTLMQISVDGSNLGNLL